MKTLILALTLLVSPLISYAQIGEYTEWMKSAQLANLLKKSNQDRLFPAFVEGQTSEDQLWYRAKFIPFLPDMSYFYSRWGMTEIRYKKASDHYLKLGFIEHSHSSFVDLGGTTLHQATWILREKPLEVENELRDPHVNLDNPYPAGRASRGMPSPRSAMRLS